MSGRHEQSASGGRVRLWLGGLGIALVAVLIAAFAGPAGASSKTVGAQLSLSGLASADNPLGGSRLGIHPGDKITFSAAGVPTAGLDKAGLGGLVGGLTGLLAKFQVTADLSGLPGGAKNTVLSGKTTKSFSFPKKGTYTFTWSFQSVNILGGISPLPPIDFSGNQLKQLGIKLNASNSYVGTVVVATNPPPGGLSVQIPTVKVAPSAPVVGQLPTLTIPGVNLPTLGVPVPDLNPGSAAPTSGTGGKTGAAASSTAPGAGLDFTPPALSVPQQVLGGLTGGGSDGGSGGNGGFRLGVVGSGSGGQVAVGGSGSTGGSGTSGSGSASGAQNGDGSASTQPVDLASSSSSPSGQLPVLLAILAVITLAMVAGIYSRLYLLGRKTSSTG